MDSPAKEEKTCTKNSYARYTSHTPEKVKTDKVQKKLDNLPNFVKPVAFGSATVLDRFGTDNSKTLKRQSSQ